MRKLFVAFPKVIWLVALFFSFNIGFSQQISTNKVFKVGVYDNPPKIFINSNGNPDGIFMDVLKTIAKKENLKFEYTIGNWSDLYNKLKNNEIDILPDMAYSAGRDSLFDFSIPVLSSWLQFFTTKQCVINRISDINYKRIGVLKSSSQDEFLKNDFKLSHHIDYSIFSFDNYTQSVDALKNGQIDLIIANRFFYFSELCDDEILPTGIILELSELNFAFSNSTNHEIIKLFNKNISDLQNNPQSEYYISLQKWLNKEKKLIPISIKILLGALLCGLLFFLLFIVFLNYKVRQKTQHLKIKNDELSFANKKIEESELFFRVIFESSPIAKSITYLNGLMKSNVAFSGLLGYTPVEFSKLNWSEITHPDDVEYSQKMINNLLEGKCLEVHFEKRYIHKNGSIIYTVVNTNLHNDTNGTPLFFITIIVDITERKLMEEALKVAKEKAEESNKLKTVFLQNMSHEIRTPMNGILGFIDLLKDTELNDEPKNQYLDIINRSGERLLNTINNIIEISKIESNQIELLITEVDLTQLMDFHFAFFNEQAKKKGLQLKISEQVSHEKSVIQTDKDLLDAILINLLNNSIKFTHTGTVEFGYFLDEKNIVFFVKDTGIGIPSDRIEHIFDQFVVSDLHLTRSHEGSGLGLSIVKSYISLLNGKIWVESEVEKGSTFYFSLPYCNPEQ